MSNIYLPRNASKAQLRDAENARKNRLEIVKAYSHGQVSRRDLVKWGLITAGGLIAPIGGLSPFVKSSRADSGSGIPTGAPPSYLKDAKAFTAPMPRLDELQGAPAICIEDPTNDPTKMVVATGTSGKAGFNALSNLRGSHAEYMSCQDPINVDPALLDPKVKST